MTDVKVDGPFREFLFHAFAALFNGLAARPRQQLAFIRGVFNLAPPLFTHSSRKEHIAAGGKRLLLKPLRTILFQIRGKGSANPVVLVENAIILPENQHFLTFFYWEANRLFISPSFFASQQFLEKRLSSFLLVLRNRRK